MKRLRIRWDAAAPDHPAHTRRVLTVGLVEGELFPAGGSAALAYAAQAHGRALEAAARVGAVWTAHRRASEELRATTQRLRAIERRWIPEHERALAALELALDEADREDTARVRWVVGRRRVPADS